MSRSRPKCNCNQWEWKCHEKSFVQSELVEDTEEEKVNEFLLEDTGPFCIETCMQQNWLHLITVGWANAAKNSSSYCNLNFSLVVLCTIKSERIKLCLSMMACVSAIATCHWKVCVDACTHMRALSFSVLHTHARAIHSMKWRLKWNTKNEKKTSHRTKNYRSATLAHSFF